MVDTKVGTRWTPDEDKLLADMWGKYAANVIKRNINHRTWYGIKSRAGRLKLGKPLADLTKNWYKKPKKVKTIPPPDTQTWANKLRDEMMKKEAEASVKLAEQKTRPKHRTSLDVVGLASRIAKAYLTDKQQKTTSPAEYDRLTKIIGQLPDPDKPPEVWTKPEDTKTVQFFNDADIQPGIVTVEPRPHSPCLLAGTRAYLCGGMDRVKDGGVTWRRNITPKLEELGVVIFDPTNKPFYDNKGDESDRHVRNRWLYAGEYEKMHDFMADVRGGDLRMVNHCDFVIIYIDTTTHLCGSYEEIAIANHEKKPILVVCKQLKAGAPWWLFGQLPHQHIFGSFVEMFEYLKGIDSGQIKDETSRWYFYRPEVLYNKKVLARLAQRTS